ncbi:Bcr/CflA family drug resistance efflux transporter [Burkholderia lata]|uniref:MFS transporter n=1 Tax=Burkholderia lata (strain ATCC 17760 / DSM 23089 / LMG 22485 / NCIMB 9086 / R18194 / 383) TaxID=482957 RepID=UPI0014531090|nr:MFS transporter [Burkholderia lata]VWD64807.1 Bcr/CflA family drug resistance efflux transporter [Burkholderia lata]
MFRPLLPISPRRALLFCLFLGLFELLTYAASDVIMPGMLGVANELRGNPRHVPMALNAYLLGSVALQWLLGPLSDRFGRRPLLLTGCLGFSLACLVAPLVHDINMFIALRFFQGIGLGFVVVVSYPVLQETFQENDAVRMTAMLGNIALLSPLLGPLLGGALLTVIDWRTLFMLIAIAAALVWLGLCILMPETIDVERKNAERIVPQPLNVHEISTVYRNLLRNRRFIAGCLAIGMTTLPLIAWIALSPILLMHNLGIGMMGYGLWQLPVFGGLIAGNLVLNRIAGRTEMSALARSALPLLFSGLILALATTIVFAQPWALIFGLSVYSLGLGVCNAPLYRLTLFSSKSNKGAVSALLGMISVATFGLGSSAIATVGRDSLDRFVYALVVPALLAIWPLRVLLAPDNEAPLPPPKT